MPSIKKISKNKSTGPQLARTLGLFALIFYGLGDILGAGIYALIGKVTGFAGSFTWLSFALAMGVVAFTALNYCELSSRYPQSGGVSIYVQKAFATEWLSLCVSFFLFGATILSMATLSVAVVGYIQSFGISFPSWVGVFIFLLILLLINVRGIKESSFTNMVSTSIEIFGLVIVLVCAFWYLAHHEIVKPGNLPPIANLLQGAALAFFAFTGFEDLANVAEEVKKPEKNLPRAILSAIGLAGVFYLAISWSATAVIPGSGLNLENAPLLAVVKKSYPAFPVFIFTIIAIFAITNTVLLNYITASRLLYGMAKINLLPKLFKKVHRTYRTPYAAIFFIFPCVFALSLLGSLAVLASSTSAMVLIVFSFSSIALIKIKYSEINSEKSTHHFHIPPFVPMLALLFNITLIFFLPASSLLPAAGLIVLGLVLAITAAIVRPKILHF